MKINFDNKLFRETAKAFDIILVGFYWMICSLPLITIGAASAAAMSVLLNDHEDNTITKMFFLAFKSNFRQATLVWLTLLLVCIFLTANFYFCKLDFVNEPLQLAVRGVSLIILMAVLVITSVIFAIIAKFKVTFAQSFYNVLVLMSTHPCLVILMVVQLGIIALSYYLLLAFGFVTASAGMYAQCKIFMKMVPEYADDSSKITEEFSV